MSNTNEKALRCFQCKENITPDSDGMIINEGTIHEMCQCDDCHLMEFGTHIMEANLHFLNKNKAIMEPNEKAQSAEFTPSEIEQADAYLEPLTRSDMFPNREAIGKGFIAGQRSMQSRISQLEQKFKAYEGAATALIDVLEVTDPYWSEVEQVVTMKQALKPKE